MIPVSKIEKLFEAHYKSAVFYCQKLVNVKEVAEDIVHGVFLTLIKNDIKINGSLESYLYSSVHNRSIDHIRRCRTAESGDDLDKYTAVDDGQEPHNEDFEQMKRIRALHNAIEELPEGSRRIFKMIQLDNLSYQETADILGVSLNTVRTQMYRAMKQVKSRMKS